MNLDRQRGSLRYVTKEHLVREEDAILASLVDAKNCRLNLTTLSNGLSTAAGFSVRLVTVEYALLGEDKRVRAISDIPSGLVSELF